MCLHFRHVKRVYVLHPKRNGVKIDALVRYRFHSTERTLRHFSALWAAVYVDMLGINVDAISPRLPENCEDFDNGLSLGMRTMSVNLYQLEMEERRLEIVNEGRRQFRDGFVVLLTVCCVLCYLCLFLIVVVSLE